MPEVPACDLPTAQGPVLRSPSQATENEAIAGKAKAEEAAGKADAEAAALRVRVAQLEGQLKLKVRPSSALPPRVLASQTGCGFVGECKQQKLDVLHVCRHALPPHCGSYVLAGEGGGARVQGRGGCASGCRRAAGAGAGVWPANVHSQMHVHARSNRENRGLPQAARAEDAVRRAGEEAATARGRASLLDSTLRVRRNGPDWFRSTNIFSCQTPALNTSFLPTCFVRLLQAASHSHGPPRPPPR